MQRLKRYQAPTREDAYDRIREECGSEVEIVSTRNVRMPGLFGAPEREYVEVVVRVSDEELERREKFAARLAAARAEAATQRANEAVRSRSLRTEGPGRLSADGDSEATLAAGELAAAIAGEYGSDLDLAPEFVNEYAGSGVLPGELMRAGLIGAADLSAASAVDDDAPVDEYADPDFDDGGPFGAINGGPSRDRERDAVRWPAAGAQPARASTASPAEFRALSEQVAELKTMLRDLALEHMRSESDDTPGALVAVRARLVERGVGSAVAVPVLDQTAQALPRNADEASVLRTVERKLAAQLPAVPRVDYARRPVVIYLVGPSGAGKTTFAVRLALDIRAHALTATVAGTDVGRAGAPQQITALGAASGVPVQLCYSPGELQTLINEAASDVVIVDTPGHSGARRDRMTELEAFMQAARRRHTLLVVPATMQGADLIAIARAYQPLAVDGLVVTRCDETGTFGGVVSAAKESGLGVAYTTHADAVNVPPRGGDNLMLARAVVAGQWPDPPAALPGVRTARARVRAG